MHYSIRVVRSSFNDEIRVLYRAKIAFRPFPQTFEQLDIYVPGFEIVNKKLNHILSLSNTMASLVQLHKGMYVRGFLLGEPSPARLTVLCFLALLGWCQILESSFFIYRYY